MPIINPLWKKKQCLRSKKYREAFLRGTFSQFLVGCFLFLSQETDGGFDNQLVEEHEHGRQDKDYDDHTDEGSSGKQGTDGTDHIYL